MQKTARREGSVMTAKPNSYGSVTPPTVRASLSSTTLIMRPRNSVKNEIIALLFDAMVNTIVTSWKTIEIKGENATKIPLSNTLSDMGEKKKTTRTFLFMISSDVMNTLVA